jgi:hypothetical protein
MTYGHAVRHLMFASLTCIACAQASAADSLGVYAGAAVGQSNVRSDQVLFFRPDGTPLTSAVSVAKSAAGWKLLVGLRPISWVGAELAYVGFR